MSGRSHPTASADGGPGLSSDHATGYPVPRRARVGRVLLVVVSVCTIVVPVLVDGVVLAGAHMQNPAWLPHAKLHTAAGFLAAIALGGAGLVCVVCRPVTDRFAMVLGAFLSAVFEVALVAAGLWPGTSYGFDGDPVHGNQPQAHPLGIDIPPNVLACSLVVATAAVGLWLVLGASATRREVR